eukprot:11392527-Alexandrium_andersonii.AAC.1
MLRELTRLAAITTATDDHGRRQRMRAVLALARRSECARHASSPINLSPCGPIAKARADFRAAGWASAEWSPRYLDFVLLRFQTPRPPPSLAGPECA